VGTCLGGQGQISVLFRLGVRARKLWAGKKDLQYSVHTVFGLKCSREYARAGVGCLFQRLWESLKGEDCGNGPLQRATVRLTCLWLSRCIFSRLGAATVFHNSMSLSK